MEDIRSKDIWNVEIESHDFRVTIQQPFHLTLFFHYLPNEGFLLPTTPNQSISFWYLHWMDYNSKVQNISIDFPRIYCSYKTIWHKWKMWIIYIVLFEFVWIECLCQYCNLKRNKINHIISHSLHSIMSFEWHSFHPSYSFQPSIN